MHGYNIVSNFFIKKKYHIYLYSIIEYVLQRNDIFYITTKKRVWKVRYLYIIVSRANVLFLRYFVKKKKGGY